MDYKPVYQIKEIQEMTMLARGTVMRLISDGKLRTIRAGRRILIPGWAIEQYLQGK